MFQFPKINRITAFVVVAVIVGLIIAVRMGKTPAEIAVLASAGVAAVSQLSKLLEPRDDTKPPPPPPVTPTLMLMLLFVTVTSCATLKERELEAETAYAAAQTKCAATEPSREAADACRELVDREWGIAVTHARRDGGR